MAIEVGAIADFAIIDATVLAEGAGRKVVAAVIVATKHTAAEVSDIATVSSTEVRVIAVLAGFLLTISAY
jgi:cytosine/adenosine deaminase-related metal-dependent hydrolase